MRPFSSPSVSINGDEIRRIREEGRLTQLYVAKVVGVTTDTVSRWENNRYPTIRRDNALKLAEALEVDLELIVKREEPAPDEVSVPDSSGNVRAPRRYMWAGLVMALLLVAFFTLFNPSPEPQILLSGYRHVPNFTAPGVRVPIRLEIISKKKLKGLIVREEFPPGWVLVEADPPPASLDNVNGSVRWMIRNPLQRKQIVYILQAPEKSKFDSLIDLHGEVVANPNGQRFSTSIPSTGTLKIAPLHWADMNGNSVIDDLEILDVSDMVDESEHIHFGWDLIEEMWDADAYSYDIEKYEFIPRKPGPAAEKP